MVLWWDLRCVAKNMKRAVHSTTLFATAQMGATISSCLKLNFNTSTMGNPGLVVGGVRFEIQQHPLHAASQVQLE